MLFDTPSIIAYAAVIILLYVFCLFFIKPVKFIARLAVDIMFGAVLIFVLNYAGGRFGIRLGLNPLTASVAGILGVPGIFLLFAIKTFI